MRHTVVTVCGALCLGAAIWWATTPAAAQDADEPLIDLVVNLFAEKDKELRALAFEQVRSEAKGTAATKRFAAELPKLSPDAQAGLLSALADRGDKAARPAVLDLLTSSADDPVRLAAIKALGSLGEPADLRQLVRLLAAGSNDEKEAARTSLVRVRGEAIHRAIVGEMKQSSPAMRAALIEILATRRALDTVPDMLSAASDEDAIVRRASMTALGELARPEHLPGMVRGVLNAEKGAEREAAEKAVMFVCRRIADADNRADRLLAAMEKLVPADRTAMLPALGRVGGPRALTVVETAIADSDATLHEHGLRAICNWPDASIAARLIELAKTDEHPNHRTMALAALIRVAPLPDQRSTSERLELVQKVMTMCSRDDERNLLLKRASAIRTVETLRFVVPYLDRPPHTEQACETVVELAHHRGLREPNKAEFHRALDKVLEASNDATVLDRANRYKKGQTWARPIPAKRP